MSVTYVKMAVSMLALMVVAAGPAAAQRAGRRTPAAVPQAGQAAQPAGQGLDDATVPGAQDRAAEASPTAAARMGSALRIGTAVSVKMTGAVDSGSVRNGDEIHGTLTAPLKTSSGLTLAAGTPVVGTVVSAAKAGTLKSGGVLSLQLTRVGALHVVTDVADFDGQEGHKDVADAAPDKGSEAMVADGAVLTFHVLENGPVPGLVKGGPELASEGPGGGGTGAPAPGATGEPNTRPGVSQRPVGGATQGVVPGPKR